MKKITHFTHKQHPLKLVSYKGERDGVVIAECAGCGKDIAAGQTSYACRFCGFYLHEPCAKLPQKLQHFFHSCPLFLRKYRNFTCDSCFQSHCSVFTYRCQPCDFDMDVECAFESLSLSSSQGKKGHFCHRHPLQLLEETNSLLLLLCQICNRLSSSGPFWSCEPCDFHVHKHCLAMLPPKVQTKLDSQLVSLVLIASPSGRCVDCKRVSDLVFAMYRMSDKYLCISCCLVGRMVDESPSKLPKVIDHFLHPCPVRLVFSPFSTCNACFRSGGESCDFFYNCKDCDFFLHPECAQPPPTHSQPDQIRHFCHLHPLELFRDIDDSSFLCRLCESSCSSKSFYGCRKCQFYIHQPCIEILPQKTIHRLLSQTIVLLTVPSFECITCNRACSGLTYFCSESRRNFYVKCVLWPENEFGQSGELKSIHHWHQLAIGETDKVDQSRCFMCGEYCSGQTYNCSRCEIFFHKQCAELTQELWTPLHPEHPLTLVNKSPSNESGDDEMCSLCLKVFSMNSFGYNGSYHCNECRFKLDSFCACRLPSVRHQHHRHLLTVVENMYAQRTCHACDGKCTGVTLACAECRFYLHLECGPLPCIIKSTFHIHSLTLEDYYAEDNEADKFACHICEEERNPRLPVYCCIEGCLMICDMKCLLPELLPILRGEHGCVVTRTTYPNVACEIVSKKMLSEEKKKIPRSELVGAREGNSESRYEFHFKDLRESFVDSALEEEEGEETLGIEFLEAGYEQNDSLSTKDDDIDQKDESRETKSLSSNVYTIVGEEVGRAFSSYETTYLFSLEAFSSFQNHLLRPPRQNFDKFSCQRFKDQRMIGVYALPETLHPLYEQLFGKHKIIDDKFKLSYPTKRYLIFLVCSVVDDMRRHKVVDLKKERILCWLGWIKYVEDEGRFDLRFVVESIKRLWKAHYVIEAKCLVDEKSKELRQRLDELSQEEDDLAKKLEATRKKIQEAKREEMAHKEYRAAGASRLKKQYKDALEIKWKPSSDCILKYPDYAESRLAK